MIDAKHQAQIAQMLPLMQRVMAQTRARIVGGDKHYLETHNTESPHKSPHGRFVSVAPLTCEYVQLDPIG